MKNIILIMVLFIILLGTACSTLPVVTHKSLTYSYIQNGEEVIETSVFIRYEFQLITGKFIGITIDGKKIIRHDMESFKIIKEELQQIIYYK